MAGGLRPDLLRELRRFPDLIFRQQNHEKRLAAGLRPDLLGELKRSPDPLAQWVPWREHSSRSMGALRRGRGGKYFGKAEMNEKGYF